ncbi:PAS domain-containing sensor histidine kinase [Halosegnis sp.]|uniref:PAS domain-containing sensor histidine kinase n=1 Tax=Halosegnis sp. TaxID=2864959 RepID=UPI0035D4D6CA
MTAGSSPELDPEFFVKMVETVGVGVGIYDQDGVYIYVNQSYADLFGVTPTALVGTPLWEVVPAMESERFDRYWASFHDGETRTAETVHTWNDKEVPVATVTTRQSIDGQPYHFGTIKDITERRTRERKIKQQNERLTNFASVVSHDLRNPLNVAHGYLDILEEDVDRDELRLVANALDRMDTLITELLELAQSDTADAEMTLVALQAVAKQAWQNVTTPEAELHLPETNPRIVADESRLQQLFENLFRNAVDHAGPAVDVRVETTSDGFAVTDDGPGIPAGERDRVFETGYTTATDGTGFGLSIVNQIVTEHNWAIQIGDAPDGGARIEITDVKFVT